MLEFDTEGGFRPLERYERDGRTNLIVPETDLYVLIHKRAEDNRTRRKGVPCTKADSVPLFCVSLAREEVFREEPEGEIPVFNVSISIFGLNTRLGRKFQLYKSVGDVIPLITVYSSPICAKVEPAKAEGKFLVDA